MSLFSVFLIGIGLSMDACAVSFAKGICLKKQVKTYALHVIECPSHPLDAPS